MLTEKENILSSTGNLSLTNRSLNESDVEHVSKISIQLGKVEKENEDLRLQLESSITGLSLMISQTLISVRLLQNFDFIWFTSH